MAIRSHERSKYLGRRLWRPRSQHPAPPLPAVPIVRFSPVHLQVEALRLLGTETNATFGGQLLNAVTDPYIMVSDDDESHSSQENEQQDVHEGRARRAADLPTAAADASDNDPTAGSSRSRSPSVDPAAGHHDPIYRGHRPPTLSLPGAAQDLQGLHPPRGADEASGPASIRHRTEPRAPLLAASGSWPTLQHRQ